MFPIETLELAEKALARSRRAGLRLATAESCTGGLIAAALTAIPGSSDVVERGFVTYANAAKVEMLGVPEAMIERFGAVSEPVALAMAEGALAAAGVELSVSATGVAGPGGGTPDKPVGLVWLAVARQGRPPRTLLLKLGDLGRDEIRLTAVEQALGLLLLQASMD